MSGHAHAGGGGGAPPTHAQQQQQQQQQHAALQAHHAKPVPAAPSASAAGGAAAVLASDNIFLYVDLSVVAGTRTVKSVKAPKTMAVGEALGKLMVSSAVQKLADEGKPDSRHFEVYEPVSNRWPDPHQKLGELFAGWNKPDPPLLQVRKRRMIWMVQLTTGEPQKKLLDGALPVMNLVPMLCTQFGVPDINMGLRAKDKMEFLAMDRTLNDQGISAGSTLVLQTRRCFGVALSEVTTEDDVPLLVKQCVKYVEEKAIDMEGIYRLSGSHDTIGAFRVLFDKGEVPSFKAMVVDPHVVSGLLKLFLREMSEPAVPFAFYDKFVSVARNKSGKTEEQCMQRLRKLVNSMPRVNRTLLHFLFRHLNLVASHRADNRMGPSNIAVVIAPNILRTPSNDMLSLVTGSSDINRICEIFVTEFKYLFEGEQKQYSSQSKLPLHREGHTKMPSPTAPTVKGRFRAEFEYTARDANELTLKAGDVIEALDIIDEHWIFGRMGAHEGLVARTYVVAVTADEPAPSAVAAPAAAGVRAPTSPHGDGATRRVAVGRVGDVPASTAVAGGPGAAPMTASRARVLYSFTAQDDEQLSLEAGAEVEILSKDVDGSGWCVARNATGTGLVPVSYVEMIGP